ncbi:MAG: VanZ family protein [Lachnospiraceae bacterium]
MLENEKSRNLTKVLFAVYVVALIEIIVFKLDIPFTHLGYLRSINMIPFHESLTVNGVISSSEILMNMIIFMPLGIYLEMLFPRMSMIKKILLIMLVSLCCEVMQYIFAVGASDITDIINNTLGGLAGILLIKLLQVLYKGDQRLNKHINILATISTILMLIFLSLIVYANTHIQFKKEEEIYAIPDTYTIEQAQKDRYLTVNEVLWGEQWEIEKFLSNISKFKKDTLVTATVKDGSVCINSYYFDGENEFIIYLSYDVSAKVATGSHCYMEIKRTQLDGIESVYLTPIVYAANGVDIIENEDSRVDDLLIYSYLY